MPTTRSSSRVIWRLLALLALLAAIAAAAEIVGPGLDTTLSTTSALWTSSTANGSLPSTKAMSSSSRRGGLAAALVMGQEAEDGEVMVDGDTIDFNNSDPDAMVSEGRVSVAIAATLMASISFQMGLFYLIRHPDEDIRRSAFEIICLTISIFCAVFITRAVNDILEALDFDIRKELKHGENGWVRVITTQCHMFAWFAVLYVSLAYICGIGGAKPDSLREVEGRMKSWAILLSHIVGFASAHAFGTIQHIWFRSSPLISFIAVPISFVEMLVVIHFFDYARERISLADDGVVDEFERLWDEDSRDAENEIMGIVLSFNIVQTLRFAVGGTLADIEGTEERVRQFFHSPVQAFILIGSGLAFLVCTTFGVMLLRMSSIPGHSLEKCLTPWRKRYLQFATTGCAMSFAWSTFYGFRWLIAWTGRSLFKGDATLLCVILALVLSVGAFAAIWVMDKIADADWTGEITDDTIREVIRVLGIMIGFAWEQCFNTAETALAQSLPYPLFSKLSLAGFSVAILIPAWRFHLLPMVLDNGWRFGFPVEEVSEEWGGLDQLANAVMEMKRDEDRRREEDMKRYQDELDRRKRELEAVSRGEGGSPSQQGSARDGQLQMQGAERWSVRSASPGGKRRGLFSLPSFNSTSMSPGNRRRGSSLFSANPLPPLSPTEENSERSSLNPSAYSARSCLSFVWDPEMQHKGYSRVSPDDPQDANGEENGVSGH